MSHRGVDLFSMLLLRKYSIYFVQQTLVKGIIIKLYEHYVEKDHGLNVGALTLGKDKTLKNLLTILVSFNNHKCQPPDNSLLRD